jgi:hypothetical protein
LHGLTERNLWRMPKNLVFEMLPVVKTNVPFRGIGDLFNFIGVLVIGGLILLWLLKNMFLEVKEYVCSWFKRRKTTQ